LCVRESQLGEVEAWLDSGRVELAILFEGERALAAERVTTLATIGTYLVGSPDAPATRAAHIEFRGLGNLSLVLAGRPNRLPAMLDDEAWRAGIVLRTLLEADSLTVDREIAAIRQGYAVLGPYAIARDVRAGQPRAARIMQPFQPPPSARGPMSQIARDPRQRCGS
jgi:DNA-binding transcriptional LysR family regulator